MKKVKSMFFRICLIAGLVFTPLFSNATGADPIPVPIPPDDSQPYPGYPNSLTIEPSASATISEDELAVYFEWEVGEAIITVYDANNNIVYQQTLDTDSILEVSIPVINWQSGTNTLIITYGQTTRWGSFEL